MSLPSYAVSTALSAAICRGPGATVDFAEVAPFDWDRVFVFGPYTPHSSIHARLGFPWSGVSRTTIEWNEGVNLVVFIRGTRVVCWFEHVRHEELEELADPNGYARQQARFTVGFVGPERCLGLVPPNR
jgi:hypothetical protein